MNTRALAILTCACMVVETLLMRAALAEWPAGLTGVVSRAFSVGVLAVWVIGRGDGWRRLAPRGAGWWLVAMGATAIAINVLCFEALRGRTTATNYALLYRLDVVFVVLIGSVLGLERIGWRELLLLPLMLLGVACVAEVRFTELQPHIIGDLMVLGGAFCFAVNAFILRKIFRTMDTEAVALINITITWAGFIAVALICRDLATVGPAIADPIVWLWVVIFGLLFAVYLMLYYVTLSRMPVWKLRMWMLSVPVLVAAADAVLWDTRLSGQQWVGMGLVLAGLAGLIRLEHNGGFVQRKR